MFLKVLKIMLFLSILFAKPVYADDFDTSNDSMYNKFIATTAFTVQNLPEQTDTIHYNTADFLGDKTETISSRYIIDSITDTSYQRRIPMVADRVYGPPGTIVDISFIYFNNTGHTVNINNLEIPLSRNNMAGDISKIAKFRGSLRINSLLMYKHIGGNMFKDGVMKMYPWIVDVVAGSSNSTLVDQVEIKNPLNIDDVQVEKKGDSTYSVKVWIQNNSEEYLNNLVFTHNEYTEKFDIRANTEYLLEYTLNSSDRDLGKFSIYNPNVKQYCSVSGTAWYSWSDTNAITIFVDRSGPIIASGLPIWPDIESMCIGRIPYTMFSQNDIIWNGVVEEEDTAQESVLGTTDIISEGFVLPKTGIKPYPLLILLVVDAFLWYSFCILRRKYENCHNNSRLCTKGRKNALERGF